MRRIFHAVLLGLATLSIGAQAQTNRVQTIADVSFAVPDGWAYQAAADFGGMAYKEGTSFWFFGGVRANADQRRPCCRLQGSMETHCAQHGKIQGLSGLGHL
jgi:hypothetical protein